MSKKANCCKANSSNIYIYGRLEIRAQYDSKYYFHENQFFQWEISSESIFKIDYLSGRDGAQNSSNVEQILIIKIYFWNFHVLLCIENVFFFCSKKSRCLNFQWQIYFHHELSWFTDNNKPANWTRTRDSSERDIESSLLLYMKQFDKWSAICL